MYIESSYKKNNETQDKNIVTEEYVSGPDVTIEIEDVTTKARVQVDEISSIAYQVLEQQKPIYGYASRTFDEMAVGNRIVTGSFVIPIKNKKRPEIQSLVEMARDKTNHVNTQAQADQNDILLYPNNYTDIRGR